jgi:hypothetical protein
VKMREYFDGIQGAGAWDRMHYLINQKQLFGWSMPPVEVDGAQGQHRPRRVTPEQVQEEIRKCFRESDSLERHPPPMAEKAPAGDGPRPFRCRAGNTIPAPM